ncbi:MAG TPA: hypothetical protein VF174_08000 [Micromonosporaceae bacterium]
MSDNTVSQPQPTAAKEQHPADGSDRWTVTGERGRVVYDLLGNHLAVIDEHGDVDSVMGPTLARTREYALMGDDDAVFAVLADVYRRELAGGAR